jgi:hypothetical protein
MDLFRRAFEGGGATPEALAQLVALHERVQRRSAELEFSRALNEFQTTCPPIPKSSTRTNTTSGGAEVKTKYADFEQIVETVRPHLNRLGLSFSFDGEPGAAAGHWTCICTLRHRNGHSIQSRFTLPTESKSPLMTAQDRVGGADTYGKRRCLISVLGLSLTDPGDAASDPTLLSEEQRSDLLALHQEVGGDLKRFLAIYGIERLEDMPARNYKGAIVTLEAKRKRGGQ